MASQRTVFIVLSLHRRGLLLLKAQKKGTATGVHARNADVYQRRRRMGTLVAVPFFFRVYRVNARARALEAQPVPIAEIH